MTIGFWGDSITYGSGDSEGLGWVGRLRRSASVDDYHQFYNFGVCGDTSAGVRKRFGVEYETTHPEQVVIALGINDAKLPTGGDGNLVPLPDFVENIETMITLAKAGGSSVVLVGPTVVGGELTTPVAAFSDVESMRYRDALADIAVRHQCQFIDMSQVLDLATDLSDGLHPNNGGYEKMFLVTQKELHWH